MVCIHIQCITYTIIYYIKVLLFYTISEIECL
jgi:hypothetical protein